MSFQDEIFPIVVTICITIGILFLISLGAYGVWCNHDFEKQALAAGYIQGVVPGSASVVWIKPGTYETFKPEAQPHALSP